MLSINICFFSFLFLTVCMCIVLHVYVCEWVCGCAWVCVCACLCACLHVSESKWSHNLFIFITHQERKNTIIILCKHGLTHSLLNKNALCNADLTSVWMFLISSLKRNISHAWKHLLYLDQMKWMEMAHAQSTRTLNLLVLPGNHYPLTKQNIKCNSVITNLGVRDNFILSNYKEMCSCLN